MMHKSQFPEIDPYDWFCGPGSHMIFKHISGISIYITAFVTCCVSITLQIAQIEIISKILYSFIGGVFIDLVNSFFRGL